MTTATNGRKPKASGRAKIQARTLKRKRETDEFETLRKGVEELDPKAPIENFSGLPISDTTKRGLEASHFKALTDIQSKGIPLALKGKDVLGAAKTGSGKTLAFLIPVLENLYRQKWTELDGLGALIISPTRELAGQIFEVLRKIGRYHNFSAGLVFGGRSLAEERDRLGKMNILVCTPGRMLQHLDQTAAFDVGNLQMLVLDEADRILDMGFQSAVDAIVDHLPKQRQTLLFSATQTKRVSDLARLSLRDPEYVAVHEAASHATPATLQQYYVITPLAEKLDTLYSFIKANIKAKIIVFMSSGKQVRFVYESFRHLQPGIPLLHLHGRQKQGGRLDITAKFAKAKNSCLFATDVVARGLDFPAVDWVIQLDCPEDADTYIHRVGRTARYEKEGKAVLFLDPSEQEGMLKRLEHKKVPIQQTKPRQKKQQSVKNQLQNMCFQDPELRYLGQKSFVSYTKSLFVQKDKDIFKVKDYDLEGYAASLGLPGAPKIKFMKGDDAKRVKNAARGALSSDDESDGEDTPKKSKKEEVRTKYDRMFERRNQNVLSEHYAKMVAGGDDDDINAEADEDADFLSVKRTIAVEDLPSEEEVEDTSVPQAKLIEGIGKEPIVIDSKRKEKLLKSKKQLLKLKEKGTKLVYDEDGNPHQLYELEDEAEFQRRGTAAEQRAKFVQEEAARVREADLDDKELAKQKKRDKKEKRKARELADQNGFVSDEDDEDDEDEAPQLVHADDDDHDPLAFLASLPTGRGDEEDDSDDDEEEEEPEKNVRPQKRPKKWFEDDSDEELAQTKRRKRVIEAEDEPETLEDLEALAAGLLG